MSKEKKKIKLLLLAALIIFSFGFLPKIVLALTPTKTICQEWQNPETDWCQYDPSSAPILPLIDEIVFFVLFIGIAVGAVNNIRYLVSIRKLLGLLKTKHPKNWRSLGEPSFWFLSFSIKKSLRVWRYINKEEYNSIGDQELTAVGSRARTFARYGIWYIAVLGSAILMMTLVSLFYSY